MQAWSSLHLFTKRTAAAQSYCAINIESERDETDALQSFFIWWMEHKDKLLPELVLHDNERRFVQFFQKMYPGYMPAFAIKKDLERTGLRLNLYGDIIRDPSVVSAFSSRYYGGLIGEGTVMPCIICDMSKDMRCPVVNHTFFVDEEESLCKIYFAQGKKKGWVIRYTDPSENCEENFELLKEMFPAIELERLRSLSDPSAFSQFLCSSLGVLAGGPGYEAQRDRECRYVATEKLYDIYERI